jgi:Asp-tRNA(Asn)/Glu-tRNA(Gln) amidotransferase A subunit family amidase
MVIGQFMEQLQQHNVDFVISPTGFGERPPKISDILGGGKGDHTKSPVYEYKMDYFTVVSNCLGVPNLTVPLFESQEAKTKYDNFPSSIRLMGHFGEDFHLLRIG